MPTPCAISGGYTVDCNKDSLGGLKHVRITSRGNIESYQEVNGIVTAITMKTGTQFFDFYIQKSTASYTTTPTANAQSGSSFYNESVTIVMNKMSAATSKVVDSMMKSSLVIIAEDRNGEVVLLGREYGLDLSGGQIGSGTAGADRSGYELTFTGEEMKISHVDPTIVAALLIPAV